MHRRASRTILMHCRGFSTFRRGCTVHTHTPHGLFLLPPPQIAHFLASLPFVSNSQAAPGLPTSHISIYLFIGLLSCLTHISLGLCFLASSFANLHLLCYPLESIFVLPGRCLQSLISRLFLSVVQTIA